MFWFVAFSGVTTARSWRAAPVVKVNVTGSTEILATATGAAVTVTAHPAVFVASLTLVTVMTAVPAPRALTKPVPETLATEEAELWQVTFWFVAFSGVTTARSWRSASFAKDNVTGSTEILATATGAAVTVTAHLAVFVASLTLVTVMTAVPASRALTKPVSETLATEEAELT